MATERVGGNRPLALAKAWRQNAIGKFWSHPQVKEANAAFTTGTLGWLAKATPVMVFFQHIEKGEAPAYFSDGALWVQANWLEAQARRYVNHPQAMVHLLEQGIRAQVRFMLKLPPKDAGPWVYQKHPSYENRLRQWWSEHAPLEALALAKHYQPPAHGVGWEEELDASALSASAPLLRTSHWEWNFWRKTLAHWMSVRDGGGEQRPWGELLLEFSQLAIDAGVDLDDANALRDLLDVMCHTLGAGINVEDDENATHPSLCETIHRTPLGDSHFHALKLPTASFLDCLRNTYNREQNDLEFRVDGHTGVPPIQILEPHQRQLQAHCVLAALSNGDYLSSFHAVGSLPWVEALDVRGWPGKYAFDHPWVSKHLMAQAWKERPADQPEPRVFQGSARPKYLMDLWLEEKRLDTQGLLELLKNKAQKETLTPEQHWTIVAWHEFDEKHRKEFLEAHPKWLDASACGLEKSFERASLFFGNHYLLLIDEELKKENGKQSRLFQQLDQMGCSGEVWWALFQSYAIAIPTAEKDLRVLVKQAFNRKDRPEGFEPKNEKIREIWSKTKAQALSQRLDSVLETPTQTRGKRRF